MILDEFKAHVDIEPSGCWKWLLAKDRQGYGYWNFVRGESKAHRASYRLFIGRIPRQALVMHICNQPSCVNPEHLVLGTHAKNQKQKADQDRSVRGENHYNAKLTREQVIEIFKDPRSHLAIAKDYGIARPSVSRIKRGETWRRITGQQVVHIHYDKGVRNARALLSPGQVREIRKSGLTNIQLARQFGVSNQVVYGVRAGVSYRGVP